jgi:hypothetical protein
VASVSVPCTVRLLFLQTATAAYLMFAILSCKSIEPINATYELKPGDAQVIRVFAKASYSCEKFSVQGGESYSIEALPGARWVDWFIRCDADGFKNLFAGNHRMRVKGSKCFCLCAAFGEQDLGAKPIGSKGSITVDPTIEKSTLSFFANDADIEVDNSWIRRNNRGSIQIRVKRVQ